MKGLRLAERLGMVVISWDDARYPDALLRLADPPPVLFLRGRPELLGSHGVAVVGARRSTDRGKDLARRLGRRLGQLGIPVLSGMALGIDAAAHRGALEVGGDTVAVMGRGADEAYPRSHHRLFEALLEGGLVVSEFLPGTPPLPHHFPRRNRILAALARAVVVVEAGVRSGALITVEHALDLGRDVWSVPGPIDAPTCAGSNQLLSEGAHPLVSIDRFAARVAEEMGVTAACAGVGSDSAAEAGALAGAGSAVEGWPDRQEVFSGPEGRLLRSLDRGPLHVDQIAALAGLDVQLALAVLVQLELDGVVEQMPGLRFRAA
jgi:DNA processing protein